MPTGFAGRRADGARIYIFKADRTTRVRDVRWGDFLNILAQTPDGWSEIKWGAESFFIRTEHVVATRPVELIFVDVGQGDGCLFVSAETGAAERIMIVDAGEADNMFQLLEWRFGKFRNDFSFHAAIV